MITITLGCIAMVALAAYTTRTGKHLVFYWGKGWIKISVE